MCGIAGVYSFGRNGGEHEAAVHAAMNRMYRRGPDDGGLFFDERIVFGHRRLAVIDPEGGRQPLRDNATGVTLTYNGEIYNFRSLREKLVARGRRFETDCDTEVLLQAYLEWGFECVREFSGMFAFALYDPRGEKLWLVRDRLGVKPLFYHRSPERIAFASSISALLAFPGIERKLDLAAASHYLATIRTTLGDRTLWREIRTLQPGEELRISPDTPEAAPRVYWEIPVYPAAEKRPITLAEAAEQTRERVGDAVHSQLWSDVPLGGFLSGGLDSCVLASLASRRTNGHYHGYSVGYDRTGYNEWPFVRLAASRYGMQCEEIHLCEQSFSDDWKHLIGQKGLPLSTPNEVGIFRLAESFRDKYTVALSGEGADEIFGGYVGPYFSSFDYDRAPNATPALQRSLARFYGQHAFASRLEHFFLVNTWISATQKNLLLAPDVLAALDGDREMLSVYERHFERLQPCSTFDAYLHLHARVNLEGLLFRADSSTMAASVELRVPFTDHHLVEWVFSLPDACKLNLGKMSNPDAFATMNSFDIAEQGWVETKAALRRAFAPEIPEAIANRPKMSFPTPFLEWFAGPLAPACREHLAESSLLADLLAPDARREMARHAPAANGMTLWPLINLALWAEKWNVSAA